jgi:hypothetical protein
MLHKREMRANSFAPNHGCPGTPWSGILAAISPHPRPVAPGELLLSPTGQLRGIVRGQPLAPRKTGKPTF